MAPNLRVAAAPFKLHLDYPGDVRLIGYQLTQVKERFIAGDLFWEKLASGQSKDTVKPIIRAFASNGTLLGNTTVDFPLPADLLPETSVFKDHFQVTFDAPPDNWVWLGVILEEDANLPNNASGETESGIIAAVPLNPTSSVFDEPGSTLFGLPTILAGQIHPVGRSIPIQFSWQSPPRTITNTNLRLNLLDSTGNGVAQQQYQLQNQSDSHSASSKPMIQHITYCFPTPATLPAGEYQLSFSLHPQGMLMDENQVTVEQILKPLQLINQESSASITICQLLEADISRRYEASSPQFPIDKSLTEAVKLAGYDLSIIPQAASLQAKVVLHWAAQTNVADDYQVMLQLLDSGGQAVVTHSSSPAYGFRPTSTWLEGEWILDEHLLELPVLASGDYQLRLMLSDSQTNRVVENVLGLPYLVLQGVHIP